MNLHWCGPRLSDIKNVALFNNSITIFGDDDFGNTSFCGEKGARINHNLTNPEVDTFFIKQITSIIEQNPNVKFMHYNPHFAYDYGELIVSNSICMNAKSLLDALNDKMETKSWMSNCCKNIPSVVLPLCECNKNRLKELFPDASEFVLQKNVGSGGFGTKLFNNVQLDGWSDNEIVLVTPYLSPAIPINIHIIVYEKDVLIFPPSVQLIYPDNNGRLIYRGCDYAVYKQLNNKIKKIIFNNARIIGEELQRYDYRGIAGIDFIVQHDNVYFIEINPRFQASTALLNQTLIKLGIPSMQELNIESFQHPYASTKLNEIHVPCSNFCYDSDNISTRHIYKSCKDNLDFDIDLDGYNKSDGDNCYQFRINFPYNISSIDEDSFVNIHDNILGSPPFSKITYHELIRIKLELLNQGVTIEPSTIDHINKLGGVRSAVFDSIDITICNDIKINCPYDVKLSELSPYSIFLEDNELWLKQYEQKLSIVSVDLKDSLSSFKTLNNIEYGRIATLATDRVRINHTSVCIFKENSMGCAFCNLPEKNASYSFNDIYEVINRYLEHYNFKHFLIGGGSGEKYGEIERIARIAEYIKQKCHKPIYAMCLPPEKLEWIDLLYESKIDEIAFNIEIFDRTRAKMIMPGKGSIPIKRYYDGFNHAVRLWGKTGNVKSLVILGLEPLESAMKGVQSLCKIGVQPVLSAFRPLKNTPTEEVIPIPSRKLLEIYYQAEKICESYGLRLGPSCFQCQNNTVSFPPACQILF